MSWTYTQPGIDGRATRVAVRRWTAAGRAKLSTSKSGPTPPADKGVRTALAYHAYLEYQRSIGEDPWSDDGFANRIAARYKLPNGTARKLAPVVQIRTTPRLELIQARDAVAAAEGRLRAAVAAARADGLSVRGIADILGVSHPTVLRMAGP